MTRRERISASLREIVALKLMYLAAIISPPHQKHSAAVSLSDHIDRLDAFDHRISLKEQPS